VRPIVFTDIKSAGIKLVVTNYRPISKLNTVPKLLEKLMKSKLYESFKHTLVEKQLNANINQQKPT